MDLRRLLRPLPLFLIALFVAVAIGDMVQKLTEEPPSPPEIAGSAVPVFSAWGPVIDFRAPLSDPALEQKIVDDRLLSYKLGVTATPTMFVNGYFIEGFASQTSLARLIEAEIQIAKDTGDGVVPQNYFQELMAQAIPESDFPTVGALEAPASPSP